MTGDRGASARADLTAALSSATDAESAAILAMAGDCARAASALNAGVIAAGAAEAEAAGVRRYLSRYPPGVMGTGLNPTVGIETVASASASSPASASSSASSSAGNAANPTVGNATVTSSSASAAGLARLVAPASPRSGGKTKSSISSAKSAAVSAAARASARASAAASGLARGGVRRDGVSAPGVSSLDLPSNATGLTGSAASSAFRRLAAPIAADLVSTQDAKGDRSHRLRHRVRWGFAGRLRRLPGGPAGGRTERADRHGRGRGGPAIAASCASVGVSPGDVGRSVGVGRLGSSTVGETIDAGES